MLNFELASGAQVVASELGEGHDEHAVLELDGCIGLVCCTRNGNGPGHASVASLDLVRKGVLFFVQAFALGANQEALVFDLYGHVLWLNAWHVHAARTKRDVNIGEGGWCVAFVCVVRVCVNECLCMCVRVCVCVFQMSKLTSC